MRNADVFPPKIKIFKYNKQLVTMEMETKYCCPRCFYKTDDKFNYTRHLKRKNLCKVAPEGADVNLGDIISNLSNIQTHEYRCLHCDTIFGTRQSRHRHQKSCSVANDKERLDMLERELNELKEKQQLKTVQNVTNNYVTNNIVMVNSFGMENTEYITDTDRYRDVMSNFVKKKIYGVLNYLELKNFNEKHPENHTIRKLNKKDDFIEVIDFDKKWRKKFSNDVLDDLFMHLRNDFEEFITEELEKEDSKLKPIHIREFMKYVGKPLDWDEVIDESSYENIVMTDQQKQELKNNLKKIMMEYLYDYSRKVFSAP